MGLITLMYHKVASANEMTATEKALKFTSPVDKTSWWAGPKAVVKST